MFGGDTFLIRAWNGDYSVTRVRGGGGSEGATGRGLEEIVFCLRHAFVSRDRDVQGAVEGWYAREVGSLPTAATKQGGPFGAGPWASGSAVAGERVRLGIWERFERALRSGELAIQLVQRPPLFVTLTEAPAPQVLESTREEQATHFEATVVDEIGQPLAGLEMVLTCEGRSHELTTNGAGFVKQDGVTASRASLRVKSVQQLKELLEPRWSTVRSGAFPRTKNLLRAELSDSLGSFSLAAKDEHLVVITPQLGNLHVEWWDERSKHRHVGCSYRISGPRSFSGETDKEGQLSHPDVPLGVYTVTLTVEYFKGRSYARTLTFEEKVEVTQGGGLQVRRVGPTPEVAFRRLRGYVFDKNKTFLMPRAARLVHETAKWWKERAPSRLLIVGHTDTTGEQAVNDALSQERADAVKAFLEQEVDVWLANYDKQASDKWGAREDWLMIRALPDFGERANDGVSTKKSGARNTSNGAGPNGAKLTANRANAKLQPETLVAWFQRTRGLEVDDIAGPVTRRALVSEYMGVGTVMLRETTGYPVSLATLGEGGDYPLADTGLPLDVRAARTGDGSVFSSESGSGSGGVEVNPLDRRVEMFFFDTDFGILPPVGDVGGPEYIEWRKRVDEESDVAVDRDVRQVTFLEIPDVLFRTESCVVLPEGEAPFDGGATMSGGAGQSAGETKHRALTGVGIFAAALRFCDERANYRVFIGGHTDSVGGDSDNDKLSKERAQVALALLTGDRDTFVSLVDKRHRVSDYKQILSWCCRAFGELAFTCDPGKIDDVEGTGVDAVKAFQAEYNEQREALGVRNAADLAVDGDVGPKTWGALFDVMQYGIAQEMGEQVADVAKLRESVQWVDESRRALGFGEKHPIAGRGLDNYESQTNRRVEVMFFEYGHEPDLVTAEETPEACDVYLPGEYERLRLPAHAHEGAFSPTLWIYLREPRKKILGREYLELVSANGKYHERKLGTQAIRVESSTVAVGFEQVPLKRKHTLYYSQSGSAPVVVFKDKLIEVFEEPPPIGASANMSAKSTMSDLPDPVRGSDPLVSYGDADRPFDESWYSNVNETL